MKLPFENILFMCVCQKKYYTENQLYKFILFKMFTFCLKCLKCFIFLYCQVIIGTNLAKNINVYAKSLKFKQIRQNVWLRSQTK
ncbi:Uncharacterised protein [Sphingobacterium multivorum]|nr:Uncharacterised protein [Sphingobacterium multivorum]